MTTTTQEEKAASDQVIPQKIRPGGDGLASPLIPLLLLLIALFVIGSALFGGPVRDAIESRQEAEPWEYIDMAKVGDVCPLLANRAKEAMADGRITNLEVRHIAEAMYAARDAREDAEMKSSAYVAIGSAPLKLPPDCQSDRLLSTYETRRSVH